MKTNLASPMGAGNQPGLGKVKSVDYYKEEIKNLQNNIEELFRDQKELVLKYEKNENYWKTKVDDLVNTNKNLKAESLNLTKVFEEKEFSLREVSNKLNIKEHENHKLNSLLNDKDNLIAEFTNKINLIKAEKENILSENDKLRNKIFENTREMHELVNNNRELKDNLGKEDNFYKDLASKKSDEVNDKIRTIGSLENKIYEISKNLQEKQKEIESLIETNNSLQNSLLKANKAKYESEFNLTNKYEKEKEELIKNFKSHNEENEANLKKNLQAKDEEFLRDIKLIEKNYSDMLESQQNNFNLIIKENEKLTQQIADCKELLKTSLEAEEKHEKIIKEYEKIFNDLTIEKETLKNKHVIETESSANRIKFMEIEIKDQNEQILKHDSQLKNLKSSLGEKDQEISKLYSENQKWRKEISVFETKLDAKDKELQALSQQITDLEIKVKADVNMLKIEELSDIIKTKNMILDDQTQQILDLKHTIQMKEQDISAFDSKVDKIRLKYDKKVSSLQKDNNELNNLIEQLKQNIFENEENLNLLKSELDKMAADNSDLMGKLEERDDIVKLIKNEILEIKKMNDANQQQIKLKEQNITQLKESIQELNKNLLMKNEESKEIIIHFEEYRREKQLEIEMHKKQISELENDISLVLIEYEKQKNMMRVNLQNLNNIFGN